MLKLTMTKDAAKFVKDLDAKQCKQVIVKCLGLCDNPRPTDSIKMRGSDCEYRADIGEYRIVYQFDETDIWINVIGKRNDNEVYK